MRTTFLWVTCRARRSSFLNRFSASADALPRFRMGIIVNAQNLTNRANYIGYSGTMTSPFFLQPTAAQGMRKIDIAEIERARAGKPVE